MRTRPYTKSELQRRHGEDAYRQAHLQAKLERKSGVESHAAGVQAQEDTNRHYTQRKFAFRTQDDYLT